MAGRAVPVVWLPKAKQDLENIKDYLVLHASETIARHCLYKIVQVAGFLPNFPLMGRSGKIKQTRELLVQGTPYLLVYRVEGDFVQVLAVMHHAQEKSYEDLISEQNT